MDLRGGMESDVESVICTVGAILEMSGKPMFDVITLSLNIISWVPDDGDPSAISDVARYISLISMGSLLNEIRLEERNIASLSMATSLLSARLSGDQIGGDGDVQGDQVLQG